MAIVPINSMVGGEVAAILPERKIGAGDDFGNLSKSCFLTRFRAVSLDDRLIRDAFPAPYRSKVCCLRRLLRRVF